jgi:hypothetical protein
MTIMQQPHSLQVWQLLCCFSVHNVLSSYASGISLQLLAAFGEERSEFCRMTSKVMEKLTTLKELYMKENRLQPNS